MVSQERFKKTGVILVATGGLSGYFPFAPGTMGSLVGAVPLWFLQPSVFFQVLLILGVGALGVWSSHEAGKIFRVADAQYIVIDEIVGLWITMFAISVTLYNLVLGFLLFRFFDVFKLPPAHYFDRSWKNGWGVMLDDVTAGIYGNIILHLMLRAQL